MWNDRWWEDAQAQLDNQLRTALQGYHNETDPNIKEVERWHRSIEYGGTKERPTAIVRFFRGQECYSAVYAYVRRSPPRQREYYWHREDD